MRTLQSPRRYRIDAANCGRNPTGHWRQQSASPQDELYMTCQCPFFTILSQLFDTKHLQKATLAPQLETVLLCGTSASLHDISSDACGKKNRLLHSAAFGSA